jgi:hypothetical protein
MDAITSYLSVAGISSCFSIENFGGGSLAQESGVTAIAGLAHESATRKIIEPGFICMEYVRGTPRLSGFNRFPSRENESSGDVAIEN